MKEIEETHDCGDPRKREIILKKLNQVDACYKNIKKYIGFDPDVNAELVQRLEALEKKNDGLACQLHEHENLATALKRQVQCEKEYNQSMSRMQANLEETRCNLQHDVLNKTAEIERISIQMKNLQSQIGDHLSQVENLHSCIDQTSTRNECEKEAIKKALKMQVEKSNRCEDGMQKALGKLRALEDDTNKCKQRIKQLETELEKLRPEAESKKELEEIDGHQEKVRKLSEELNSLNAKKMEMLSQFKNITCLHEQGQNTIAELNSNLQTKNEIINQLNCKLEDKECSNLSINRQLEKALGESNRLSRIIEDRAMQLEKQNLGHVKELESQLQCTKQEIKQLKAEKQDLECKYGRQMQDLRDKLEQCDLATHNMQSYISYLKTAYASVFNDPNIAAKCPPPVENNSA